ncbi:MAG: ATPase [Bacteroidetes bacterium]|nr:ATPase [Bacteroidota bacterium]
MEAKIARYNFTDCISFLVKNGKSLFGDHFTINTEDHPVLFKLFVYFFKDMHHAENLGISFRKGILLTGPVGCGKTSLMTLMRTFLKPGEQHMMKPCRDVSFEFIQEGYSVIQKYSRESFQQQSGDMIPKTFCFDDLGVEQNLKYYGNECNVMAEVLLSRYDLFVSRNMITHITTNLSATEIESTYGNRVRSRLREMFNLVAFNKNTSDKRY